MDLTGPITFLLYLIIAGAILLVVQWLLNTLEMPRQVRMAVLLILAVMVLLWLFRSFGVAWM